MPRVIPKTMRREVFIATLLRWCASGWWAMGATCQARVDAGAARRETPQSELPTETRCSAHKWSSCTCRLGGITPFGYIYHFQRSLVRHKQRTKRRADEDEAVSISAGSLSCRLINMKKMSEQLRWKAEIRAIRLTSWESSAQGALLPTRHDLRPTAVIWNITRTSVCPISNASWKFHSSPFRTFLVILLMNRQTNTTSLAEVTSVPVNR